MMVDQLDAPEADVSGEPSPEEPADPGLPDGVSLAAGLEALLLISAEPVTETELAAATGTAVEDVGETLRALSREYLAAGRGFELRQVAGGWRFYSAATCAPVVARWVTDGRPARLSQAALETLAVIAYRQPVSRATVGSIRGVNVDAVVRTLVARGLVQQCGEDPVTGAGLYGTTDHFLERMGLTQLAELPPIVDLLPDPADIADHVDGEALDLP